MIQKYPKNHWDGDPDSALTKTVCVTATSLRWPSDKSKSELVAGREAHRPRACKVRDGLLLCWSSSLDLILCYWEYSTGLDLPKPLFLPQIPNDVHMEPLVSPELQWKHFLPLAEHPRRTQGLNHRKKKPFILGPEVIFLVSVSKGHFGEP